MLIPEKLYGREREIDALLAAFDWVVAQGRAELVLVAGYSGVGKSSVVNETACAGSKNKPAALWQLDLEVKQALVTGRVVKNGNNPAEPSPSATKPPPVANHARRAREFHHGSSSAAESRGVSTIT